MKKQHIILLSFVFLFFYSLNSLMPMSVGDDYFYTFVYNGQSMLEPLPLDVKKVSSLYDLLVSQINFYLYWSGRFANNTISQVFAWVGKDIFNIFNAVAMVVLLLGIYACVNRGKFLPFQEKLFLFLLFIVWTLNPMFSTVALWMIGSCHYIWPAMWLVWFLVPYIRVYYEGKLFKSQIFFSFGMFFLGILAGNGNENTSCWMLLVLSFFIWEQYKKKRQEIWMYFGFIGLLTGYMVLMLSPGNLIRLQAMYSGFVFSYNRFLHSLLVFSFLLCSQIILWYFCLRFIIILQNVKKNLELWKNIEKDVFLVKICFVLSFLMLFCMFFSPTYQFRSGFPSLVQLMIASGIVLRIRFEQNLCFWNIAREKLYVWIMSVSFCFISVFSFYYYYQYTVYNNMLLEKVNVIRQMSDAKKQTLVISCFKEWSRFYSILSGYHVLENHLSENENDWANVTFARYYGIGGIRVKKSKE